MSISADSRWITGPNFLLLSEAEWPKEETERHLYENISEKTELRKEFCAAITTSKGLIVPVPAVERFSKWLRLLRTTAWMLHFVNLCLKRDGRTDNNIYELKLNEMCKAEILLCRKIQTESFLNEIIFLKRINN